MAALALVFLFAAARPAASSSDYYWKNLWGIRKVGADKAWATGTGKGATIAIVDTGVDTSHEDLRRNIAAGKDIVGADAYPTDENGHGTHVAGIAAAVANNGIGVAGVAPDAKIMPVRVLNKDGTGDGADVDEGIHWAADHGADVVNLSLGDDVVIEDVTGGTMSEACDYAWSKGAICVVAAGNDRFFRTEFAQAKAIIVTATRPDDAKASYATGAGFAPWGMAAPGGDSNDGTASAILSTYWNTKGTRYAYEIGTSMAAPHVSGAAAILRGLGLSPQQTVDRLLATAKDIGSSGNDLTFGHGRLDVAAAVAGLHPKGGTVNAQSNATATPAASQSSGSSSSASSGATGGSPSLSGQQRAWNGATPSATSGARPSPAAEPPFVVAQPRNASRAHASVWPLAFGAGAIVLGAGLGGIWWVRRRA